MIDLFVNSNLIVLAFIVLIVIVLYKVLIKKKRPSNYYTPYDYITGQSEKEFHEEKLEDELKRK